MAGRSARRPVSASTVIVRAAAEAIVKPPGAPNVSTARPEAAAAMAEPAALAEFSQVNACVST